MSTSDTPRTDAEWKGYVERGEHDAGEQFARQLERELAQARAEVEQSQAVVMATRALSIENMAAIREAAGAPKADEDKSHYRAVDYVIQLRSAHAHALEANRKMRDNWQSVQEYWNGSRESAVDAIEVAQGIAEQMLSLTLPVGELHDEAYSILGSADPRFSEPSTQRPIPIAEREPDTEIN